MPATLSATTRDSLFASTRWTVVYRAADSKTSSEHALSALSELCQIYWRPVYVFFAAPGNLATRRTGPDARVFCRIALQQKDVGSGMIQAVVHQRMGGFAFVAALDDSSSTVYVANDDDGTVSLFAK